VTTEQGLDIASAVVYYSTTFTLGYYYYYIEFCSSSIPMPFQSKPQSFDDNLSRADTPEARLANPLHHVKLLFCRVCWASMSKKKVKNWLDAKSFGKSPSLKCVLGLKFVPVLTRYVP